MTMNNDNDDYDVMIMFQYKLDPTSGVQCLYVTMKYDNDWYIMKMFQYKLDPIPEPSDEDALPLIAQPEALHGIPARHELR